jgi:putative ABC transport system substrate-binding protein
VVLPRTTRAAEPNKVYRIALLSPVFPVSEMAETSNFAGFPALLKELKRLGYVEGSNLVVLRFSANGDPTRYDTIARDAVRAAPDVIFANSSRLTIAAKAATSAIPVVGSMGDPIGFGIVTSIARPDGNVTGVANDTGPEIWGKRLAMLLETVPTAKRVAFLVTENLWDSDAIGGAFREAARQLSVSIVGSTLKGLISEAEYRRVFETFEQEQAQGFIVADQAENRLKERLIIEWAEKARLPGVYFTHEFVRRGGLMAYTYDIDDNYRRAAGYVDSILKGAKPRDLPIHQMVKYQTVINLKTAKAIGLELPQTLLAQADEVIE